MKIKKINYIMVVQWDDEGRVRYDVGYQKVDARDIIKVCENIAEGVKEQYGLN